MRPYASTRLRKPRRLPPLPQVTERFTLEEALAIKRTTGCAPPMDLLTPEALHANARVLMGPYDHLPKAVRTAIQETRYGVPAQAVAQFLQDGKTVDQVVEMIKARDAALSEKFAAEKSR